MDEIKIKETDSESNGEIKQIGSLSLISFDKDKEGNYLGETISMRKENVLCLITGPLLKQK